MVHIYPRHSMYAIYAYIDPQNHPNVSIYGIHGVFGYGMGELNTAVRPPLLVSFVHGTPWSHAASCIFSGAMPGPCERMPLTLRLRHAENDETSSRLPPKSRSFTALDPGPEPNRGFRAGLCHPSRVRSVATVGVTALRTRRVYNAQWIPGKPRYTPWKSSRPFKKWLSWCCSVKP